MYRQQLIDIRSQGGSSKNRVDKYKQVLDRIMADPNEESKSEHLKIYIDSIINENVSLARHLLEEVATATATISKEILHFVLEKMSNLVGLEEVEVSIRTRLMNIYEEENNLEEAIRVMKDIPLEKGNYTADLKLDIYLALALLYSLNKDKVNFLAYTDLAKLTKKANKARMATPSIHLDKEHFGFNERSLASSGRDLSQFKTEEIEKEFQISIHDLMLKEYVLASDLVPLKDLKEIPRRYFEEIYNELSGRFRTTRKFPTDLDQVARSEYLERFIMAAVYFVKNNVSFENSDSLIYGTQEEFEIKVGNQMIVDKADFVIRYVNNQGNGKYIAVFEAKRCDTYLGLIKCIAHLRAIYDLNNDHHTVFGFCATDHFCSLISYSKADGYRLHQKERLLFPRMFENETYKEYWMENCKLVPQILFSVLAKQLSF